MTKSDVDQSILNVIAEIDQYIDFLKENSIRAIQMDNLEKGQEILGVIKKVNEYRSRVQKIYDEWINNVPEPKLTDSQTERFIEALRPSSKLTPYKTDVMESLHGKSGNDRKAITGQSEIELDPNHLESLTFTRAINGTLGDLSLQRPEWRYFVEEGIQYALERDIPFDILSAGLPVQMKKGELTERGFTRIQNTNISLQCMNVKGAARCLLTLATILQCNLNILLEWGNNENARFPGRKARLVWQAPNSI